MKLLATGGRDWPEDRIDVIEYTLVRTVLGSNPPPKPPWELIVGEATGADALVARLWREWGHPLTVYRADWNAPCKRICRPGHRKTNRYNKEYCPGAGVYRNQLMVDQKPDLVVAFPTDDSRGTWDCVDRAKKANLPVIVTRLDGSVTVQ